MIDNYDSFTYNLVQYFAELRQQVEVYRNDQISLDTIAEMKPDYLVLSPGPCTPNEAGISMAVIERFKNKIPILGVCLGHQSIVQVFGGNIVQAGQIMHGKTSLIHHNNEGVFQTIASPFKATRYHSLVAKKTTLPKTLTMTAWTENSHGELDEIMGVKHQHYPIEGVQFHPESILTQHGHQLLNNFIKEYQTCPN